MFQKLGPLTNGIALLKDASIGKPGTMRFFTFIRPSISYCSLFEVRGRSSQDSHTSFGSMMCVSTKGIRISRTGERSR